MTVGIIGVGIYSIALALKVAKNKHKVIMWSENPTLVSNMAKNNNFNPIVNKDIPKNITLTNNINETCGNADLIIMATSAKYVRSVCESIKDIAKNIPICLASKGIENKTCAFLSDIISKVLQTNNIGVISGPTFAIDLINDEPCCLSLAINNKNSAKIIIDALASNILKIRVNADLIGTEICGSIKNVIAIASGILDGLGFNDSTRCFLITESLHDIQDLLRKLKCNPNTILSYAGIGDLMLTCSSIKSRNYKFGLMLGRKENKETITEFLENNTVEGYYTLFSIKKLIADQNIKMPIIDIIYDIVVNNKNPEILPEFLINKD